MMVEYLAQVGDCDDVAHFTPRLYSRRQRRALQNLL